jgi:hypothetical protein
MLATLISACAGNQAKHSYVEDYRAELEKARLAAFSPDSLTGPAADFHRFLDGFSAEMVADETTNVHAKNAYLNDTLKTVRGNEAIRDYFVETFENVESVEAQVVDVVGSGRSWYFRWHMTIVFDGLNKGEPSESIGVTHVVFDDDGKVAIHQDYWDAASAFFVLLPIAGPMINAVKDRL